MTKSRHEDWSGPDDEITEAEILEGGNETIPSASDMLGVIEDAEDFSIDPDPTPVAPTQYVFVPGPTESDAPKSSAKFGLAWFQEKWKPLALGALIVGGVAVAAIVGGKNNEKEVAPTGTVVEAEEPSQPITIGQFVISDSDTITMHTCTVIETTADSILGDGNAIQHFLEMNPGFYENSPGGVRQRKAADFLAVGGEFLDASRLTIPLNDTPVLRDDYASLGPADEQMYDITGCTVSGAN